MDIFLAKFALSNGNVDGLEEYLPISAREVCGFSLPAPVKESCLKGFEEEAYAMTIPDFLTCLDDQPPDFSVGCYRVRKAYPGELFYAGPWNLA